MTIVIVIIIIVVIIALISGSTGPTGLQYESNLKALDAAQFHCDKIVWTEGPTVANGEFHGRMSQACEVVALGNGGIAALEDYLSEHVVQKAAKVYATNYALRQDGLDGVSYDVAVRAESNGDTMELRGTTKLVSDSAIELVHSFHASREESAKSSRWLRGVDTQLQVQATLKPNWYRVVLTHEATVIKPSLISSSRFQSTMADQLEKKVAEESKKVLTSVANQL